MYSCYQFIINTIEQWRCGVDYDQTVSVYSAERIPQNYVEKCGTNMNSLQNAMHINYEGKDWDYCKCKRALRVAEAQEFSQAVAGTFSKTLSNPWTRD